MSALNTINGVPGTANPFTLARVLRGEWRFDGLVVSDYKAVKELIAHGVAADEADAARLALHGRHRHGDGEPALQPASAPAGGGRPGLARHVDEAVRRVLRLKFRLGLFDRPYADEAREARVLSAPEHQAAAREVAARSMVLLKNEGERAAAEATDSGRSPSSARWPTTRDAPLGHWRGDGRVGGRRDAPGRDRGQGREPARRAGRPRQGLRDRGGTTEGYRRGRPAGPRVARWRSSPSGSRRA